MKKEQILNLLYDLAEASQRRGRFCEKYGEFSEQQEFEFLKMIEIKKKIESLL